MAPQISICQYLYLTHTLKWCNYMFPWPMNQTVFCYSVFSHFTTSPSSSSSSSPRLFALSGVAGMAMNIQYTCVHKRVHHPSSMSVSIAFFSVLSFLTGPTFTDPLTCSFLILPFFVTTHINLIHLQSRFLSFFVVDHVHHQSMLRKMCEEYSFHSSILHARHVVLLNKI